MDEVTPIDSRKRVAQKRSHRSKDKSVELWKRASQAYQLKVSGRLPSEIAEIMEIEVREVDQLLAERYEYDASYLTNQDRKAILAEELITLSQLKAAVMPAALMGDPKAVDSAVKIVLAAHKIAGLEQVDPVVQKNLVLVMGDKEEDYIAALKATGHD